MMLVCFDLCAFLLTSEVNRLENSFPEGCVKQFEGRYAAPIRNHLLRLEGNRKMSKISFSRERMLWKRWERSLRIIYKMSCFTQYLDESEDFLLMWETRFRKQIFLDFEDEAGVQSLVEEWKRNIAVRFRKTPFVNFCRRELRRKLFTWSFIWCVCSDELDKLFFLRGIWKNWVVVCMWWTTFTQIWSVFKRCIIEKFRKLFSCSCCENIHGSFLRILMEKIFINFIFSLLQVPCNF